MFPDFEENLKAKCRVKLVENETGSKDLKNGSNDFLQIQQKNTFLHAIQYVLVVYRRKVSFSPNLIAQF